MDGQTFAAAIAYLRGLPDGAAASAAAAADAASRAESAAESVERATTEEVAEYLGLGSE